MEHREEEEEHCDIEGCTPFYPEKGDWPYGWCNSCEEFSICHKQDAEHNNSLLYNEGCRKHHNGGYSVCLPCAKAAYERKFPDATDERCICPVCGYYFGTLEYLQNPDIEREIEQETCDIRGCIPFYPEKGDWPYGWCQKCEEFSICHKQDAEHDNSLLYNEGCRKHHNGGYCVCIPCAKAAYKKKNPGSKENRGICPVCAHDFGLLDK
jgi:hypothetical protein